MTIVRLMEINPSIRELPFDAEVDLPLSLSHYPQLKPKSGLIGHPPDNRE